MDPIQSLQGLASRNRAGLTVGICGLALACLLLLPSIASATTFSDPRFSETTLPITGPPAGPRDPTAVDWAPDGRMFVAEKFGRVHVIEPGGIQGGTQETLIDLRPVVNNAFDRGLLGLAVDSDFDDNGYLWLVYTREIRPMNPDTTGSSTSVVSRLEVEPDNDLVTPTGAHVYGKEKIVLGTDFDQSCPMPGQAEDCIPADYSGHSINTIRSAPDGTLWISNGDSHSNGTIDGLSYRPYDSDNFAGKLIHINRNGSGVVGHPFCPGENRTTRTCTKVYAIGFRNPYRFTLRPGAGPALGDVGNVTEEELDLIVAGGNYGWPCYEGSVRNPLFDQEQTCQNLYAQEAANPSTVREPAWSYPRDQGGGDFGSAIVVGPVYGGPNYPAASFNGKLFVGDYVDQTIKVLTLSGNQVTGEQSFATEVPTSVDLAEMPNGDLGYVDINFGQPAGFVRRIIFSAVNQPPTPVATANPTQGLAPLQVQFTGSNSSDPEDDDLTYRWNFGDGTPESTQANPTHTYQQAGTYTARLTVDDGSGSNPSATVQIEIGDQPTANITSPADGSTYRDGQPVNIQGTGSDPTDGTLSGAELQWQVILHHNTHQHLAGVSPSTGGAAAFTPLTDHDADSNYEIRLTATDSDGNSDTDSIEIDPELSRLTFQSTPIGAPITYAGHPPDPAPLVRDAAVGFSATIEAASSFTASGRTYLFQSWSDGGAQTHQISVPTADTTYTATYVPETPTAAPGPPPAPPAAPEITRTDPESPANDNFPSVIGSADPGTTVALYSGRRCSGAALTSGSASIFGSPGLVAEVPDDSRTRFWARATGSRGDSPCSGEPLRYIEDSTAPVVEIRRGPSDKTKDRWPTFRFRANERQASFLCKLDRRKWRACDSPKTYRRLALGDHVFRVRAIDEAGNAGTRDRLRFDLLGKRHSANSARRPR